MVLNPEWCVPPFDHAFLPQEASSLEPTCLSLSYQTPLASQILAPYGFGVLVSFLTFDLPPCGCQWPVFYLLNASFLILCPMPLLLSLPPLVLHGSPHSSLQPKDPAPTSLSLRESWASFNRKLSFFPSRLLSFPGY